MSADLIEQVKALDQDQRAELAELLSPHVSIGRRSFLGLAGVAGGAAMVPNAARAATREAVQPAAAADGILSDIDVLESGDGTPIGFGNAVEFDHQSVSSATTIGNVTVVEYDSSVAGFPITIPASLELPGMVIRFLDESGSADTNNVPVQNSGGGTVATIDAAHSIFEVWWDGSEWLNNIFTERVNARELVTESLVIGGTLYELDGTYDYSGASSQTYSLSSSADEVIILPDLAGGESHIFDQMRVNGETGANYSYLTNADAVTSGANEWEIPEGAECLYYHLKYAGNLVGYGAPLMHTGTTTAISGRNFTNAAKISQFTFIESGGSNVPAQGRVYRRSMNV